MRADRLINMIMILQTRSKVTAAELAEVLEVSERTVYRDVVALSTAGVPVYTEKGPGGGIRLVEDYRTTLTGLSPEEAQALFMLNVPEAMAAIGASNELQSALLKLSAALPRSLQHAEFDVRQRVLIDSEFAYGARRKPSSLLIELHRAVWEDQMVCATVRYSFGITLEHEFAPYSLVASGGKWFVIGKAGENYLRLLLDRIVDLKILASSFEREPSFDLRRYWQTWKEKIQSELRPFVATVLIREDLAGELAIFEEVEILESFPVELGKAVWRKMMLGFGYFDQARAWVLRFGSAVRVVDPDPLRISVIDFAHQILEVYEHPVSAGEI